MVLAVTLFSVCFSLFHSSMGVRIRRFELPVFRLASQCAHLIVRPVRVLWFMGLVPSSTVDVSHDEGSNTFAVRSSGT
jgi:hypothetical protein